MSAKQGPIPRGNSSVAETLLRCSVFKLTSAGEDDVHLVDIAPLLDALLYGRHLHVSTAAGSAHFASNECHSLPT